MDKSIIPPHLLRLMNEGYILWFYNNYLSRRVFTKEGEQFWVSDGILHAKSVSPYKSKEIIKGESALYRFENELGQYQHCDAQYVIGDYSYQSFRHGLLSEPLQVELRKKLRIPFLPDTHSYYDLIDGIIPMKAISFHKPKVAKANAFDAKKSKIAVFGWLLKKYPNAVIIPEFGIGGSTKTSVVDMAAFDTTRMIFVEIKAENDTFVRVAKQLEISAKTADEVWLAIYEAKEAPKEIHENVGILSLAKNGKTKVLRKAKSFMHEGNWIGHVLTTDWHDSFRSIKGANKWLVNQREGIDGLYSLGTAILGEKARQFTIDVWRSRYQMEFLWRKDNFEGGNVEAVHTKRGMKSNDHQRHFEKNYNWYTDQLPFPQMADFVEFGFSFPTIEKRPTVKSFKQQILEKKAEKDRLHNMTS